MSYIDTIPHERIGSLLGYPLYHPKICAPNKGVRWGAYDFYCTPSNLVLGGGSGEHPGLVIHHLDKLACSYLFELTEMYPGIKRKAHFLEQLMDKYVEADDSSFEYCEWGADQVADIVQKSKEKDVPFPYSRDVHDSFEAWLGLVIGSFCVHHRQSLLSAEMQKDLQKCFAKGIVPLEPHFENISFAT